MTVVVLLFRVQTKTRNEKTSETVFIPGKGPIKN